MAIWSTPVNVRAPKLEGGKISAFTGKGGVGKTTCSSATALHLADRDFRTLLVSTDPAPSLSDLLEADIRACVTPVPEAEGLFAVEMDYDVIEELWKERYGDEVYEVASSFFPLGREIVDYFARAPGVAQEFALSYILQHHESGDFDRIVWDTAPAGGTISLLRLQEKFYSHLGEAAKLYADIRGRLKSLAGGGSSRSPSDIISEWRELARRCLAMVRDRETRFYVVTVPEWLDVRETYRIVEELEGFGAHLEGVVANRVVDEEVCGCDYHSERGEVQARYLKELEDRYRDNPGLWTVPKLSREVRGIGSVRRVEEELFG